MYQVKFYNRKGNMVKRVQRQGWYEAIQFMGSREAKRMAKGIKATHFELTEHFPVTLPAKVSEFNPEVGLTQASLDLIMARN
jgi:hypothetical protein